MSRARPYTYTTQTAPPAEYYYDDADGYVGDYSENDSLSDTPNVANGTSDVTELYRRKTATAAPAAEHYHQSVYVPAEYYYDGVSPQVSHKLTPQYRKRAPVVNDRARYYTSAEGELYDAMAFRSAHQIAPAIAMSVPPRIPSASNVRQPTVRRHPITVRTPRYYRRSVGTGLYKRPSALCLPVACQPDPAVYRRSKRIDQTYTQELVYQNPTATITRETANHATAKHAAQKMKGHEFLELNITKSKLDAALERYEHIFEKGSDPGITKAQLPNPKLIQMIKPRVPNSIKEKQQKTRLRRHHRNFEIPGADTLEVEEVASDVLEEILLADLTANGLTGKAQMSKCKRKNEKRPKSPVSDSKSDTDRAPSPRTKAPNVAAERPVKDLPKSFNYQEIQKGVVKTQKHQHEQHQQHHEAVNNLEQNNPSRCTLNAGDVTRSSGSPRQDSPPNSSRRQPSGLNLDKAIGTESIKLSGGATVPKVLIDDALELHRTKSYVVNLIDHALSNHFGTNLCEKYAAKDLSMDHRVAMEILKKHSPGKIDKDLCVEIAQALADTFHSTTNCSTPAESTKQESTCSCSKITGEEPLYVKQLKQLRWGHLKHIQREVRRLEDLERFLDSCSSNSFV